MDVRQEEDRVPGRKIVVIAAIVAVVSAGYILAAVWIENCSGARLVPAGPRHEVPDEVNTMEMTLFDTELPSEIAVRDERAYLNSFGWVDPQAGIAHVPIEVAIDMYLARRGVDTREGRAPEPVPVPGVRRAPGAIEPGPPEGGAPEETIR